MARYAVIDELSGSVVNVVEWDGNAEHWTPDRGLTAVASESAGPGWTYTNNEFFAPKDDE